MTQYRKYADFMSFFDDETGGYLRTGIMRDGKDTGEDPFMAPFPELLDIGIMGHCAHGASGLCPVGCYQSGTQKSEPNMSVDDFEDIASQCKGRAYQFALGGRGDPDQHESFSDILAICRSYGIVPNFTTSGFGMTQEKASLCAKYCGAVAVSWYRAEYTQSAINMLLGAGVKTNIHYVLSKRTVGEALALAKGNTKIPEGINAVVFLLHKPVGLGGWDDVVEPDNQDFREFVGCVTSGNVPFKVGFDSCTVPALIGMDSSTDVDSLDTCEGARWSAYVSPDMKMMPCSFDQEGRWAVDLREHSMEDAWNGAEFEDFREHFWQACPSCKHRGLCFGGCPICPEVVPCTDSDRKFIGRQM